MSAERSTPSVPLEDRMPIPEIERTWKKVAIALPPSNPRDPNDPRVNLDTLAAIATGRSLWLADAEVRIAALEQQLEEAKRGL